MLASVKKRRGGLSKLLSQLETWKVTVRFATFPLAFANWRRGHQEVGRANKFSLLSRAECAC